MSVQPADFGDVIPFPAVAEPDAPCESCGRLPLHLDRRAAEHLRAAIHDARLDLPSNTERTFRALGTEDRLAIHGWIRDALRRPPLSGDRPEWSALVELLDALAWDLAYTVGDPAAIPGLHPAIAMHDQGIANEPVGAGQSRTVRRDGIGLEVDEA